jgi:hypothetical protein
MPVFMIYAKKQNQKYFHNIVAVLSHEIADRRADGMSSAAGVETRVVKFDDAMAAPGKATAEELDTLSGVKRTWKRLEEIDELVHDMDH